MISLSGAADSSLLRSALQYAALGWPVLPLCGKKPLSQHGSKDATTDPTIIERWWNEWPDANVGLATGYAFFALDVDVNRRGEQTLDALERQYGYLLPTVEQTTVVAEGTTYSPCRPALKSGIQPIGSVQDWTSEATAAISWRSLRSTPIREGLTISRV